MDAQLVAALTERARLLAGRPGESARVLAERSEAVVVRVADVVLKAHCVDTDPDLLATRIRIASGTGLDGVLLRPVPQPDGVPVGRVRDRVVTAWPAGEPVDPDDPDAAPWYEAGRMLARLHRTGPVDAGPASGAPSRVARAVALLQRDADAHPAAAAVRDALATLPPWTLDAAPPPPGRPRTLCHGDWHLGQLVRLPGAGWRLLDVDDLGYDDPAWDLARPAAWYATGLMPPVAWREFLDSYRGHGGPAVPRHGDPWPALDAVARALVVQMAARTVTAAVRRDEALDDGAQALLETCLAIAAEARRVDVP